MDSLRVTRETNLPSLKRKRGRPKKTALTTPSSEKVSSLKSRALTQAEESESETLSSRFPSPYVQSEKQPQSHTDIEQKESEQTPGFGTTGQASAIPEPEEEVVFRPNPGPQTAFLAAPEREVLYGGAGGGGKHLPKSLILLAFFDGKWQFKRHGDLVVGDYVMHPSGKPVKVTHIHPDSLEDVWELEVDSGVVIPCSGTHKWRTLTLDERDKNCKRTPEYRAARRAKRPSRAKANSKKPGVQASLAKRNSEAIHTYLEPVEPQSRSTK